jgi:uncharacterized protein (DUF1800 family)
MTRLRKGSTNAAVLFLAFFAGCGADGMGGLGNGSPSASLVATPASGLHPGTQVTLDASTSSDPDGDTLTFEWVQTSGPAAPLSSPGAAVTTFYAPPVTENAALAFSVTVRDGRGGQASQSVNFTVEVGAEFTGSAQSLAPYRDQLTSDEAYHLLRRAVFGARPDEVAQAVAGGLNATVDNLIQVPPIPEAVAALAAGYEADVPRRWLTLLIEGNAPLQDRLTMFWHDRFATSRRVLSGSDENLGVRHWEMLRANALGNYRGFLESLTIDPLMLIWLDGANSPRTNPNENYTREFWELFTLGRDVLYTEDDIKEGSRAFTGITLLRQSGQDARPIFDLTQHDQTLKSIFPSRAPAANHDYQSVIDLTLAQPEAPRYVARNLFAFLVHDHPSDAVVQELADMLVSSNWEISPLVRTLLKSHAMFSFDARGNQVTSPVEHVIGIARTFDMHMTSEDSQGFVLTRLADDLGLSGQELLNPPGVEGWGEDEAWLQDQWVINRARALGRTMEYGPFRTTGLPFHLLPTEDTWTQIGTQRRIVDALAGVLHLNLSEEERNIYISVLDQNGQRSFTTATEGARRAQVFEMMRLMTMDDRVIVR